jgi:hypothetical protein
MLNERDDPLLSHREQVEKKKGVQSPQRFAPAGEGEGILRCRLQ